MIQAEKEANGDAIALEQVRRWAAKGQDAKLFWKQQNDIEVKTTSKALNVRVVPWKFVRVKDEGTPLVIY